MKDQKERFALNYRDLRVYQQAFRLSLDVHTATLTFPKIEQYALADQLRRSSKSVCANIVEGYGRQQYSRPDFERFLVYAIGSCNETLLWLEYAEALNYINKSASFEWTKEYNNLLRMLHKLKATS